MLSVIAVPLVALAGWGLVARPDRSLRVASVLVSHTLCSEVFVAGLPPDQVFRDELAFRPGFRRIAHLVRYTVDRRRQQVTTRIAGLFYSRAAYRGPYGCVTVQGHEPPAPAPTVAPDTAAEAIVEPTNAALRSALDRAFTEHPGHPPRHTTAVVVLHNGQLIAERYAPGYGPRTPLLGYSATKSVTSALIGILVRHGTLSIDQSAPVPEWSSPTDPRRAVTIDQLLRMTSGLDFDEDGPGLVRPDRMFFLEPDMARFAAESPLVAPPGTRWAYSSCNTLLLDRIIRDAAGGHARDVLQFAHRELFDPLGMRDVTLEFDNADTPIGALDMLAPARAWARFGQLYLDDGIVAGHRILPEGWVRYSASPTLDHDYGAGFWTNWGQRGDAQGRTHRGMPEDAFFASGLLGQRVVIIPSAHLVIVRMGSSQEWPAFDIAGLIDLVRDVVAATR
jgi:CubicO group peptidase (beta-lactamase class C family)